MSNGVKDEDKLERVLYSESEISKGTKQLAAKITTYYESKTKPLVLVCVLKGGFVFAADLMRAMKIPATIEFIRIESYEGTASNGNPEVTVPLKEDLSGKNVLLVDDLIETGLTLALAKSHCEEFGADEVKTAVLIDKPFGRSDEAPVIDWVAFKMKKKEIILGYGCDYEQSFRGVPYIGIANKRVLFQDD